MVTSVSAGPGTNVLLLDLELMTTSISVGPVTNGH